jgi:hypothetical protein
MLRYCPLPGKSANGRLLPITPSSCIVLKVQVTEANAVRPRAGREIGAPLHSCGSGYWIGNPASYRKEHTFRIYLGVAIAEEQLRIVGSSEVDAAECIGIFVRRVKSVRKVLEGRSILDRHEHVLICAVALCEVEQLVLDEGSAYRSSILIAVVVRIRKSCWLGQRRIDIATAVMFVRVTVNRIRARLGRDVNEARRTQIIGKIHRRLRKLKFLNRVCRDVSCRRSDGFVGNVRSVSLDAGRSPDAAAELDRGNKGR